MFSGGLFALAYAIPTMNNAALEHAQAKVYAEIEHKSAIAAEEITRISSRARRAMGQRFRKLERDLKNEQNHE
jgi:hypothetical protein